MSHFVVAVIGKNPEKQLAPFDENKRVKKYVEKTKEQIIADERQEIEDYKNQYYAEYLSDPIAYAETCKENSGHLEYLKVGFPAKMKKTDEELYKDYIADYKNRDLTPEGGVYSTYNPNSKWDWYQLGGRWTGYFKLKPGKQGEVGEKSLVSERTCKEGYADQALKGDIDFDGMRDAAEKKAAEHYDMVMKIIGHLPVNKTFEQMRSEYKITNIARIKYWEQPRCDAFQIEQNKRDSELGYFSSPDDYIQSREEYLKSARGNAVTPFAVLKDGKWYEKGTMGMWGMVRDEKEKDDWISQVNKLYDEMPDDTLISMFDCHI